MKENAQLASTLLSLEPEVTKALEDYDASTAALRSLRSSLEAKLQQQGDLVQRRSPQQLQLQLQAPGGNTRPYVTLLNEIFIKCSKAIYIICIIVYDVIFRFIEDYIDDSMYLICFSK